jgi:hypothetical protein
LCKDCFVSLFPCPRPSANLLSHGVAWYSTRKGCCGARYTCDGHTWKLLFWLPFCTSISSKGSLFGWYIYKLFLLICYMFFTYCNFVTCFLPTANLLHVCFPTVNMFLSFHCIVKILHLHDSSLILYVHMCM